MASWQLLILVFLVAGVSSKVTIVKLFGLPTLAVARNSQQRQMIGSSNAPGVSCTENKDEIYTEAAFKGSLCFLTALDETTTATNFPDPSDRKEYLKRSEDLCRNAIPIEGCFYTFLDQAMPCAKADVKAQIDSMKNAFSDMFIYFCDDDMINNRHFVDNDGLKCIIDMDLEAVDCLEGTNNINMMLSDMPEDRTSSEAIETCQSYDRARSCILRVLQKCPNPAAAEFFEKLTEIFRRGSYCSNSIPLEDSKAEISNHVPEN